MTSFIIPRLPLHPSALLLRNHSNNRDKERKLKRHSLAQTQEAWNMKSGRGAITWLSRAPGWEASRGRGNVDPRMGAGVTAPNRRWGTGPTGSDWVPSPLKRKLPKSVDSFQGLHLVWSCKLRETEEGQSLTAGPQSSCWLGEICRMPRGMSVLESRAANTRASTLFCS